MTDATESLWIKACKNIDNSTNANLLMKERQKIRYLLVMGSSVVGKTELLSGLFDRTNGSSSAQTLAMDYTFGRRAGRSLEKNIVNVWELGGDTALLSTTEAVLATCAESSGMAGLAVIVMLDLYVPNKLWVTLEDILHHVRTSVTKQTSKNFPTFLKDLQADAWKRVGGKNKDDKDSMDPFPVPLVIIGGKYDLFQDFESEKRRVICHCLQYMAHSLGATLLFYSSKDVNLLKKARDVLMMYAFGHHSPMPSVCTDVNKPLFITPGTDSVASIASAFPSMNKDSARVSFLSHFPQDVAQLVMPDDPAKDVNFREVSVDTLRAIKEEALSGLLSHE